MNTTNEMQLDRLIYYS